MKNTVKNATRHLLCKAYEAFAKDKTSISLVSLPGDVWEFENYVVQNNHFASVIGKPYDLDITLAESNANVYHYHARPKFNFLPHNVNSAYVLKQNNVSYHNEYLNKSHVDNAKSNNIFGWFDFCGNPTKQDINLINTAKGKNVTFVFTFNTAWRMDSNVCDILRTLAEYTNKTLAIQTYLSHIAEELNLKLIWCFEYVANRSPMVTICYSNDENVIADKSLNIVKIDIAKKNHLTKRDPVTKQTIQRAVIYKRDLSAVYTDVKAGIDKQTILAKHNINSNTLAAVKAWITMGK